MKKKNRIKKILVTQNEMAIIVDDYAYVSNEKSEEFKLEKCTVSYIERICNKFNKKTKVRMLEKEVLSEEENFKLRVTRDTFWIVELLLIFCSAAQTGMLREVFRALLICTFVLNRVFENRMKIKYLKTERTMARRKGALCKTINAYNKLKKVPTVEEIKKASFKVPFFIYIDDIIHISFFVLWILTKNILCTILNNSISIILVCIILILLYYNIVGRSQLAEPTWYEIKVAQQLIKFYDED